MLGLKVYKRALIVQYISKIFFLFLHLSAIIAAEMWTKFYGLIM